MLIGANPLPVPVGPHERLLGEVLSPHAAARQDIGKCGHAKESLLVEVFEPPWKRDSVLLPVLEARSGAAVGSGCRHPGLSKSSSDHSVD